MFDLNILELDVYRNIHSEYHKRYNFSDSNCLYCRTTIPAFLIDNGEKLLKEYRINRLRLEQLLTAPIEP